MSSPPPRHLVCPSLFTPIAEVARVELPGLLSGVRLLRGYLTGIPFRPMKGPRAPGGWGGEPIRTVGGVWLRPRAGNRVMADAGR